MVPLETHDATARSSGRGRNLVERLARSVVEMPEEHLASRGLAGGNASRLLFGLPSEGRCRYSMPVTASASSNRRFEKPGFREDRVLSHVEDDLDAVVLQLGDELIELTTLVSDRHDDHGADSSTSPVTQEVSVGERHHGVAQHRHTHDLQAALSVVTPPRQDRCMEIDWFIYCVFDPDGLGQDFAYTDGLWRHGLPELHIWARPPDGPDPGADWSWSDRDMMACSTTPADGNSPANSSWATPGPSGSTRAHYGRVQA